MKFYWDFIQWLEHNQFSCVYKKYLGIECPGCGMQQATILLLKGDIWGSILAFPALIPLIIMFLYLLLHVFFKFKNGAKNLVYMFIINAIIIVCFYIFKQFYY